MSNFFSIYSLRELPSGRIEVSARATDPDQEGAHIVYNAPREYLWSARIGDGVRVDPVLVVFADKVPARVPFSLSSVSPALATVEVAHPDSETFLEEPADPFGDLVAAASAYDLALAPDDPALVAEERFVSEEMGRLARLNETRMEAMEYNSMRLADKLTDYSFLAP